MQQFSAGAHRPKPPFETHAATHRNWDVELFGSHAATHMLGDDPPVPPEPLLPPEPLPPEPLPPDPPVPCVGTQAKPCCVKPGRHSKSQSASLQMGLELAGGVLHGEQP